MWRYPTGGLKARRSQKSEQQESWRGLGKKPCSLRKWGSFWEGEGFVEEGPQQDLGLRTQLEKELRAKSAFMLRGKQPFHFCLYPTRPPGHYGHNFHFHTKNFSKPYLEKYHLL